MSGRTLKIEKGGRLKVNIGAVVDVELVEYLGSGASGQAWKVADPATGKLYALKIIQELTPGCIDPGRVRLEAEVQIPSENVVQALGLCEWDKSTFLILFELFQAESLDELIAKAALTDAQKREILIQMMRGVAAAHRCNIVHRDLKPQNILVNLNADGRGKILVKVIDFGISKFKDRNLTKTGTLVGTAPYIPLEDFLALGSKAADARADIYALGCIFYEVVKGYTIWQRQGWKKLEDLLRYLQQTPRPTAPIDCLGFPCSFFANAAEVLEQMIVFDKQDRFQSVEAVLTALGVSAVAPEPPSSAGLRYPVLIIESGDNGLARTLINIEPGGCLVLGRADIAGNDESISRRHLEFLRDGDDYLVRDVDSKNGTFKMGIQIPPNGQPTILQNGDHIKVGDIFLRFEFESET